MTHIYRHIYLAGPITGLLFDEAKDWREEIVKHDMWADHWLGLSPMRDKEHFRIEGPLPSTFDEGAAAVMQDLNDIEQAEVVLMNLHSAKRPSIGTMCELGYARAKNKFVIVVMEPTYQQPVITARDPRVRSFDEISSLEDLIEAQQRPYEEQTVTAVHDHIFVHEMATKVVPSLEQGLATIHDWERRKILRPTDAVAA